MRNSIKGTLAVLLSFIAIVTFAASQKTQENVPSVQAGIMSEKQRHHSKLHEKYKTGRKLDGSGRDVNNREAFTDEVYIEPPIPVADPSVPALSFDEFLRSLSCAADAVLVVEVTGKSPQLTANREFIFTDYSARTQEILKNNDNAPLNPEDNITITRPGGKVKINDRIVSALDASFLPLEISNRYLLFLKHIPVTGSYEAIRKGSFLLSEERLVKLTEESLPDGNTSPIPFTAHSRSVIKSVCHP